MSEENKKSDAIALILTAPIATISIIFGNMFAGILGSVIWVAGKFWQIGLPAFWRLKIEGKEISWSKSEQGGWALSAGLGIGMSVVMIGAWLILGDRLDTELIKGFVEPFGLLNPWMYFGLFCYWVFVNSVMEEYLFRWFIFEKFETFVEGKMAVILSALAFTAHHLIATLMIFPVPLALLASFGVFIGGAIWSWLYLKYRSIWVCYLSHAIVDVAMFGVGAYILFA